MRCTKSLFCFLVLTSFALGCTEPVETNEESVENNGASDSGNTDNQEDQGVSCNVHEDCESRVCGDDGVCSSKEFILYVSKDGSESADCGTFDSPCSSIQDAVDKSHEGLSTISIGEGRYAERIGATNKSLSFIGYNQPELRAGSGNSDYCSYTGGDCILEINESKKTIFDNIKFVDSSSTPIGVRLLGNNQSHASFKNCVFTTSRSDDSPLFRTVLTTNIKTTIKNSIFQDIHVSLGATDSETLGAIEISQSTFNGARLALAGENIQFRNSFVIDSEILLSSAGIEDNLEEEVSEFVWNIEFLTFVLTDEANEDDTFKCQIPHTIGQSIVVGQPEARNYIQSDCSFENSLVPSTLSGTNNFFNEPLFFDESNGDLRLERFSPAIDRLRGDFDNRIDIEGDPRPLGGGFDIGADEHAPQ